MSFALTSLGTQSQHSEYQKAASNDSGGERHKAGFMPSITLARARPRGPARGQRTASQPASLRLARPRAKARFVRPDSGEQCPDWHQDVILGVGFGGPV